MVIVGRKPVAYVDPMSRYNNFKQLKKATQNFDPDNKIGEGKFSQVYRGILSNGKEIAVKQLSSISSIEGKQVFLNELGIVSALNHHPNLVKFLGCCTENNQLLLIYEYMENNSLYNALFGIGDFKWRLNWETRFEICLGIAKGLAFLHEESTLKIIHRDITATNILLDKDLNAKISGFALAIHHDKEEGLVTEVRGTCGYTAPEYVLRGLTILCSGYTAPEYVLRGLTTYKTDVYSFGVVMLEILSGIKVNADYRPNDEIDFLLDRACVLYNQDNLLELMDPDLKMDYKVNQANRMLNLAMLCTDREPAFRPKMSEVVSILQGKTELKSVPFLAHYSDDGFGKASASAEKSDALHETSCSKYDTTDANHEKETLAGDDHADIQEYDFEDAASTMQLHDHHSLMEEEEEEEEEEENNNAGVPDDFDGGSSSSKVNDDQSTLEGGQKDDAKLFTERNFPVMPGPSKSSNARKSWYSTTLFTGHVTKMNEEDKGKLEYVEPSFDEDGKLCIRYSEEEFEEGCNEWKDSLVGFFVGDDDKPLIMNTILNKQNVETLWGVKEDDAVSFFSMEDGYFLIQFKYTEDKIKVLESGPWHIENRPLILREWNWKLKFDKANEIKTLPIWVKIYNLPLFLWTPSFLSKVGSALGTPLYSDEKTKNKERLDFARLCIQVDASKSLPNSLNISVKGVDYEIRFAYDWKPLQCAKTEDTKPIQCAKTEDTIFLCFLLNLSVLLAFQFIFMFM